MLLTLNTCVDLLTTTVTPLRCVLRFCYDFALLNLRNVDTASLENNYYNNVQRLWIFLAYTNVKVC